MFHGLSLIWQCDCMMNIYFAQESPELFQKVKETVDKYLKNINIISCSLDMVVNGEVKSDSSCLLMMDLDLPGKNTLGFLNEIKSKTKVPIVVLDDMNNGPGRMVKALRIGAEDYLFKPIRDSQLIASIITNSKKIKYTV